MKMKAHWSGRIVKLAIYLILFLFIAIAGFGQAVHHLWNWLMPSLFGLPAITFWQAVGLLALSWLLFGGWRGVGRHGLGNRGQWRNRMQERWEQMTPEERAKFREGVQGRCGPSSADARPVL
jgi:Ca2+/H+ antiporter, TMEM165/GDT1 family